MKRKPKQPKRQTITLAHGGFGRLETGFILATKVTTHTVGKQTVTLARHTVQMDNAYGPFGASVRFVFGQSQVVNIAEAA